MMNTVKSGNSVDMGTLTEEIDRLKQEHMDLKDRLTDLSNHRYLTSDQQFERRELQKRKLLVKDRILTLSRHTA